MSANDITGNGRSCSAELISQWDQAYHDLVSSTFGQPGRIEDTHVVAKRIQSYQALAHAWQGLSIDDTLPLWARHAAAVAAVEFDRRAHAERASNAAGASRKSLALERSHDA